MKKEFKRPTLEIISFTEDMLADGAMGPSGYIDDSNNEGEINYP